MKKLFVACLIAWMTMWSCSPSLQMEFRLILWVRILRIPKERERERCTAWARYCIELQLNLDQKPPTVDNRRDIHCCGEVWEGVASGLRGETPLWPRLSLLAELEQAAISNHHSVTKC